MVRSGGTKTNEEHMKHIRIWDADTMEYLPESNAKWRPRERYEILFAYVDEAAEGFVEIHVRRIKETQ